MSDQRPAAVATVAKLMLHCLLGGVLAAALMLPIVGGAGVVANRLSDVVAQDSAQLVEGEVPIVSTMVDAAGNPIAWLYAQRRWVVPSDRIADTMKLAIVSIEDKRFADHNGVDVQGTLTGLAGYLQGRDDTRGGSTIEQQYVKNYNLLVNAQTDAERRAAIETTPARKLREIRMALELDKVLSKPEILTRYLNLVSFGNGAYGVQDAARTYFGVDAAQLNWQQAALLAGMVQSTSALNPVHQPRRRLGATQPRARHHDREPARQGRRTARRPGRSRWASCLSPTGCRRAASPPAIVPSSASTRCSTWRARASTRSRWRATAT